MMERKSINNQRKSCIPQQRLKSEKYSKCIACSVILAHIIQPSPGDGLHENLSSGLILVFWESIDPNYLRVHFSP